MSPVWRFDQRQGAFFPSYIVGKFSSLSSKIAKRVYNYNDSKESKAAVTNKLKEIPKSKSGKGDGE